VLLIFRPFTIGHKVQIGDTAVGTVKALSLLWTELVTDDKAQIIVPNGSIWRQPLRNYSIFPAPPRAFEIRFRLPEGMGMRRAVDRVRPIVEAEPRVLDDPAPRVLLDCSAAENPPEMIVAFFAGANESAVVKSDLIKAVNAALDTWLGDRGYPDAAETRKPGTPTWRFPFAKERLLMLEVAMAGGSTMMRFVLLVWLVLLLSACSLFAVGNLPTSFASRSAPLSSILRHIV
jgi:Mechanosensitive ion channel